MPEKACEFVVRTGTLRGRPMWLKCQALAVQGDYCPVHRGGKAPQRIVKRRVKHDLDLDVLPMDWSRHA